MKTCKDCNKNKPESEFYKKGKYPFSFCKICQHERNHQRKVSRRIKVIKLMGGKCSRCGYDENYAALDMHHKDPSTKELSNQDIKERPWQLVVAEIKKCVLLCKNCHTAHHNPHLSITSAPDVDCADVNLTMETGICPTCNNETFGTTFCSVTCSAKSRRKVKRPYRKTLLRQIQTMSWSAIGRHYGVSDNAVRKWAKKYDLL